MRQLLCERRFFLGALLPIAGLLLAGCGGLQPDPQAHAAAEWALKRGGTVEVFGRVSEIKSRAHLPRGGFALESINMNEIGVEGTPVTDSDLEVLKGLTNLRYLGLYGSAVTDKGCEIIASLETLRKIELSQSRITDKGLKTLASLPNLETLFIRNVGDRVTKKGVEAFKKQSDATIYW